MSPASLLRFQSIGRNWKEEEPSPSMESDLEDDEHTMLEREVADIIIYLLHRQGSDTDRRIRRRTFQSFDLDFRFPRWNGKRKRSVQATTTVPASHGVDDACGDSPISFSPRTPFQKERSNESASPLKSCKNGYVVANEHHALDYSFVSNFHKYQSDSPSPGQSCPNVLRAYFNPGISETGIFLWPSWRGGSGGREFVVPDLNLVASPREDLIVPPEADGDELHRRQKGFSEIARRRLAAADARRKRKELQRMKRMIDDAPLCSRVR